MKAETIAAIVALLSEACLSTVFGINCRSTSQCECLHFPTVSRPSLFVSKTIPDPHYQVNCTGKVIVNIELADYVKIHSCSSSDPSVFSNLTDLRVGKVEILVLQGGCSFPGISIKEIMTNMGITEIKRLFILHGSLENMLNKKLFENLYEVIDLSLAFNSLNTLPEYTFKDLSNLTYLNLSFNRLVLQKHVFSSASKLEVLDLSQNSMTRLVPGTFKNLTNLRRLYLEYNRLESLEKSVLSDLPNLKYLNLNYNGMKNINPDVFFYLINLEGLDLHENEFENLPPNLLSRNTHLKKISMTENKKALTSLPPRLLANLPELKTVTLTKSKLRSLPEDFFNGSRNIESVHLNGNKLTTLHGQTFNDLEYVEEIDLSSNEIVELPKDLFLRTHKLKKLFLYKNNLKAIDSRLFWELLSLEYLDLSFNRIEKLEDGFYSQSHLKTLNLSDNCLTNLKAYYQPLGSTDLNSVLYSFRDIEDLQLSNNSLTVIYDDWKRFLRLKNLNLSFNNFSTIHIKSLDSFKVQSPVTIDLSNNNITLVDFNGYPANKNLPTTNLSVPHVKLNMNKNPLSCNCKLLDFVLLVQGKSNPTVQHFFDVGRDDLKCRESDRTSLVDLSPSLLTCPSDSVSKNYTCPKQCVCFFSPYEKGNFIQCERSNLNELPGSFDLLEDDANHTEMHLDGNRLSSFEIPEHQGYENVTHFYLANNSIESVNFSRFSINLKVLDLSYNRLSSLPEEAVSFLMKAPELTQLSLHGNPWECGCQAARLVDMIKHYNGKNKVVDPHSILCANSMDQLLYLKERDLCPNYSASIFSTVFIIVMAIIPLQTALYYKYKREIHIYCYSSRWRVVRWMVSHPDLDENKIYDAFVTFANEDDDFVLKHLVPELEQNGETKYKLCFHYRDWVGGESIVTQIFKSVRTSRRTIVVLSPNFLRSVWGRLEFKTAHAEALKEGIAKVIVILYKDVGDMEDLDEELKAYLKMNTYIKWGCPWFWEQLKYALPHSLRNTDDIQCGFGC